MSFDDLTNDTVSLIKADGTTTKIGIKATVSPGKIIIFDGMLQIQPLDHILRDLPNGLVEDYIVIDPGFHKGMEGAIPDHYQIKVRRTDLPLALPQTVINNITNNTVSGSNARININSTDNSTNSDNRVQISGLRVANFLDQVKPLLSTLPEPMRSEIALPIQVLENEVRSGKPDQSKMISALQSAKVIAEGTAGNLLATGIGSMIGGILAGG